MVNQFDGFVSFIDNLVKGRKKILWDEMADRYSLVMEKMRLIANSEKMKPNISASIITRLDSFIHRCQNPEFHIAVVGVVKAGKSTLINALLDKDIASISITPETAALTKFRAGKGKNFIKVEFYKAQDWEQLWKTVQEKKNSVFMEEYQKLNANAIKGQMLNRKAVYIEFPGQEEKAFQAEIKKWTSSKEAAHYFVKEVEVGIAGFNIPESIVFVDTPGLDDVVKYRSDITRNYLDEANAVILCVPCQRMTAGDLVTMFNVFANCRHNPEKVYTLGTQVDALTKPDKWNEQKEEWVKYLKGPDCYGSEELARKNIIGVAALLYNLGINSKKLNSEDEQELQSILLKYFGLKYLNNPNWTEVRNITSIPRFRDELYNKVIKRYQRILFEDIKQNYFNLKKEMVQTFEMIKGQQEEIMEHTNADIKVIREKRKECLEKLNLIEGDQAKLKEIINSVRKLTGERAQLMYDQINQLASGE